MSNVDDQGLGAEEQGATGAAKQGRYFYGKAMAYDKQAADLYRQAEAFVNTLKPVDR
jgi:hypothetical protein